MFTPNLNIAQHQTVTLSFYPLVRCHNRKFIQAPTFLAARACFEAAENPDWFKLSSRFISFLTCPVWIYTSCLSSLLTTLSSDYLCPAHFGLLLPPTTWLEKVMFSPPFVFLIPTFQQILKKFGVQPQYFIR